MISINWGSVPDTLPDNATPFVMRLVGGDFEAVRKAVNSGISSRLEAVFTKQSGTQITVMDNASLKELITRLFESGSERAGDLASSILEVCGYESI